MLLGKNESYKLKEKIGHGSFGEVWLVKSTKRNKKYVLKKLKLHGCSEVEQRRAILESQLLSTLVHPNIVTYHDSFFESSRNAGAQKDKRVLNIIMGYCEGGDLYEHIQSQKGDYFEESQIVEWFIQICMALQYLHDKRILHRDLKTRNVFLTRSHLIKLGDFGIARILDGTLDMAATLIGTPYYMSPEILTGQPYNHKSDIWSLGCCVYEMASLRHPFKARNVNSLTLKVLHGKVPTIPNHYSQDISSLTDWMLKVEPDERPSAHCLLEHPFIHKHILRFLDITKHRTCNVDSQQHCSQPLNLNKPPFHNDTDFQNTSEPKLASDNIETQSKPTDKKKSFGEYELLTNMAKPMPYKFDKDQKNIIDQSVDILHVTDANVENMSKLCCQVESDGQESDSLLLGANKSSPFKLLVESKPSGNINYEANECSENHLENRSLWYSNEARARRRNLQDFVRCASLEHCKTTIKEEIKVVNHASQRPNTSARLRRRNRLSEACESSKPRPKSAPSRLKKNTCL